MTRQSILLFRIKQRRCNRRSIGLINELFGFGFGFGFGRKGCKLLFEMRFGNGHFFRFGIRRELLHNLGNRFIFRFRKYFDLA